MNDLDGVYTFKNGNEYRGGFKPSTKTDPNLVNGCFEGQGHFKVAGIGTFIGRFSNNQAFGHGRV